jgi:drug/metabolite transporter (DMT)-like permease
LIQEQSNRISSPNRETIGVLLVVCGTVAFAISVIIAPAIYASGSDPLTFIWVRSVFVASTLAATLVILKKPVALPLGVAVGCVAIGVLMTVQTLAFFTAIGRIPVSIGTLIEYTYPFQVAIVARLLYGDALPFQRVLLILGALAGLVMVIEIWRSHASLDSFGVGLMVVASMLLTAKTMTTHRLLQRLDSRRTSLYLSLTVAVVCSVAYVATPLAPAWPATTVGWWLLGVAPIASLAGMLCFYTGLARIGPSRAAMLANCEPIFVLLLAMMLLGETFTVQQSIGALLVIVCVAWFQKSAAKP